MKPFSKIDRSWHRWMRARDLRETLYARGLDAKKMLRAVRKRLGWEKR